MDYEIVTLEEKCVAGFCARTNNASPDMGSVIGNLWQRLYSPENTAKMTHRTNEKALGLYTDYSSDENGDYTAMAGFEVDNCDAPEEFQTGKIPAGIYAKFIVKGNMVTAVREFWQKLWGMDLKRSYICDFEEYQNADPENAEIHIYIGLKEDAVINSTIESRCGTLCSECKYREPMNCGGCIAIDKPFWGESCDVKSCCEDKGHCHCGECKDFVCEKLHAFAYDEEEGDNGRRIERCKKWSGK